MTRILMIVLTMLAASPTGVQSLLPQKDRVLQNYYYDDMEVDDDEPSVDQEHVEHQEPDSPDSLYAYDDDDNHEQNHNVNDQGAVFNPNQGTVPPYNPGPLGGSPNPFAGAGAGNPHPPVNDGEGVHPPVEPQQGSPNPNHNITPSVEISQQEWGHSTDDWGTHILQHLADAIWPLIYDNYSIASWHQYFCSFSWYAWAEASSDHAINGQMWSTQSWYNWYRDNMTRWSSLVWTLCYLGVTPSMVARMMISLHGRTAAMAKSKL